MFHPDLSLSGPNSLWAETEIKRRGGKRKNREDRTPVHGEHTLSRHLIRFRHKVLSGASVYTARLFWGGETERES